MTSAMSALSTLAINPEIEEIFQPGDVAVIMRADGSVKAISTGLDGSRLESVPEDQWTDADRLANLQSRKLLAVSLALSNPMLLGLMHAVIDDPTINEQLAKLNLRH